MTVKLKITAIMLMTLGMCCCSGQAGETQVPVDLRIVGVQNNTISFEAASTSGMVFTISSNYPWQLKPENLDWAIVTPQRGSADVKYTVNVSPRTANEGGQRQGSIVVESGGKTNRIAVSQKAPDGPEPEPEPDDTSVTVDGHPRLLLTAEDIPVMKERIENSPMLLRLHEYVMSVADNTLPLPVNERVMTGQRLLNVSVDNMTRIFYCSWAYRMTGDRKYSDRAAAEMLKAASFTDWNPDHFLDVAEMTMGMALGYDWCYPALTEEQRAAIKKGIVDHGMTPGMMENDYTGWQHGDSNWNQVCNTGLLYGALAIVEDHPQYAEYLKERAVRTIVKPMAAYEPHGAYPEGPAYWCYGTAYNVFFLSLLKDYYGTDYGLLDDYPGFNKTVDYSIAVITPTYQNFSYSDQKFRAQLSIVPFWFYSETGNSSYLYMQDRILEYRTSIELSDCRHQRTLPAALVFGTRASSLPTQIPKPSWLGYAVGGVSPIAVFRSGWGKTTDVYLGFKSGTPTVSHGHMDIGSFYFEANAVRWAIDLGGDSYNTLEQAGIDLWNYVQDSDRWKILRLGVQGHNCLMFDDSLPAAAEGAGITDYSTSGRHMFAVANLSAMYRLNGISEVHRVVSLVEGKYAVIQDRITTGAQPTTVRWAMCTEATAATHPGDGKMVLTRGGKKLYVKIDGVEARTSNWSAEPPTSVETSNPGKQYVGFHADLEPGKTYDITVYLMPDTELTGLVPPYSFD